MTPVRVRQFDINTVRISSLVPAYNKGRECLKTAPVASLSWEWLQGDLHASGTISDPSGSYHAVTVSWDGEHLKGSCDCGEGGFELCPHQIALVLHLLKVNPWRHPGAEDWQDALDLALPRHPHCDGDSIFIYRLEVLARTGDMIGRLRLKLQRARWGKQGLGHATPYPASRLRSTNLDFLPPEEASLLSWLLPLQGWTAARGFGYVTDPRYLEIPPPLVETALEALRSFDRCYFGDQDENPLHISETTLSFALEIQPLEQNSVRLVGRLYRNDPARDTSPGIRQLFLPEIVVGARPSFAVNKGVFFPIVGLRDPTMWELTQTGEVIIPARDVPTFIERHVPPLSQARLLDMDEFARALPDALTGVRPSPLLTLEERGGTLAAHLFFRYGPDLVLSSVCAQEVEVIQTGPGRRLLIQRNRALEDELKSSLIDSGLEPDESGRFEASGDTALLFLFEKVPTLLEQGWTIEGEEQLEHCRPSRVPVRIRGALTSGTDWLRVGLQAEHGHDILPMSEVFQAWQQGRRFVRFGNGSHALLPEKWLARNKALLKTLLSHIDRGESAETAYVSPEPTGAPGQPCFAEWFRVPRFVAPQLDGLWDDDAEIETDEPWRQFQASLSHFEGIEDVPLPRGLRAELREYQHKGLNWLCFLRDHDLAGILADDMGLGKTVQALALLLVEKESCPKRYCSLVVAPTSVIFNWEAEARRFTPDLEVVVLHGANRNLSWPDTRSCDVIVTSYTLLRRDLAFHQEQPYHYVILDEAQWVKNPDSQTAAAARALNAGHRLTLTGTPIENRLAELWSQFAFLMPGLFPNLRQFVAEYVTPIERDRDPETAQALRNRIYPFILRRLKEDVASELPPRTDSILYCELEGAQHRLYQAVLQNARERVRTVLREKGIGGARPTVLDALLKLRLICCHPGLVNLPEALAVEASAKLELFRETLLNVLSERHRVLVFSQFVKMLTVLKKVLDEEGIPYEYLDGRTRDRQTRVDSFNNGTAPVFLISLRAGGTGLNLASADYVIHYDPWWNPAVEDQATDRAYRIGQTRPVFGYKLIARDTVEEKIVSLQERKRGLVSDLLGAEPTIGKMLTKEDLEFLFEGI